MAKEKGKKETEVACKDMKCPRHGSLSVHGRNFQGTIKKIVGRRVVIEFERLIYYKKYERFAKARTKLHAYLPECMKGEIKVGDVVKIGECRPLSKIMHFVVLEKIK